MHDACEQIDMTGDKCVDEALHVDEHSGATNLASSVCWSNLQRIGRCTEHHYDGPGGWQID